MHAGLFDLQRDAVDFQSAQVGRRALDEVRCRTHLRAIAAGNRRLELVDIAGRVVDKHLHQGRCQFDITHHQLEEIGVFEDLRRITSRCRPIGHRTQALPEDLRQFVDRQRFPQVVVHASGQAFFAVAAADMRGHGDDRHAHPAGTQAPGHLVAIHFRHLAIHQNQIVLAVQAGLKRFGAVNRLIDVLVTEFGQNALHHHHIDRVVFGHQQARSTIKHHGPVDIGSRARRLSGLAARARRQVLDVRCRRERELQNEGRSLIFPAIDPDRPSHQFDQLPGDRQAEPGAAVFSRRRRIGLFERRENFLKLVARNTDSRILDFDVQDHSALAARPRRGA